MIHHTASYKCHCCGSINTKYIQHYILRRSLAVAPLYLCNTCQSISVDYEIVKYHYPVSNFTESMLFHRKVKDRNKKWSISLFHQIKNFHVDNKIECVIDIGCGIGTLLSVAADLKLKAIGYEIDEIAASEARKDSRLKIYNELFTKNSYQHENTLVCCIAVLEHTNNPLELLKEISEYCKINNSKSFIFAPLLPHNWSIYLNESATAKGNPFFDNEEHVTHFSNLSLSQAWHDSFGVMPNHLTVGGWAGFYFPGYK